MQGSEVEDIESLCQLSEGHSQAGGPKHCNMVFWRLILVEMFQNPMGQQTLSQLLIEVRCGKKLAISREWTNVSCLTFSISKDTILCHTLGWGWGMAEGLFHTYGNIPLTNFCRKILLFLLRLTKKNQLRSKGNEVPFVQKEETIIRGKTSDIQWSLIKEKNN